MERDPTAQQRYSSYFSACMMSPTCFPVHDEFQYSRIHCCGDPNKRRSRRWRNILRKFMRESKSLRGSKPLSFKYDPVSYSQNFDEGCHLEDPRRHSQVFHHGVRTAAAPASRIWISEFMARKVTDFR
ncbi:hypothetical protein L6164_027357 [Bauhinia variegata]|uniref:Uncharacterized protein n=1 Tax=Bauhinia variegata TaxID=167791 RepID=A0ACB9LUD0_BAUVA|nr:hypothetical protein L6164_027357 [Bauhinia variegata]